ncbi:histidine phosphatase family protein [Tabrizicola sp. DMG-N-6]|uniref:Histidine phosphatase family protein n=2 Tax=Szabonella alba TaxID=2804194 RepID=A0A8K0VCX5_9RHOB|nr:histidine phosphatase family protein [Szabonella alba]
MLMRHATAPGTGDPPGFRVDDCATQRTLSDAGRDEARRRGAQFRAAGIRPDILASSGWCRARETAELLDLGAVTHWPSLDSFFADRGREGTASAETLAQLRGLGSGRALLVTHQVNITALTGIVPRSGEIIVTRLGSAGPGAAGRLTVLGRLPPP